MGMYVERLPLGPDRDTTDLNQGDVLSSLVVPLTPVALSLTDTVGGNKLTDPRKLDAAGLAKGQGENSLRVVLKTEVAPRVMVLSATCDNARGTTPLLLAEIREFKSTAEDGVVSWDEISAAATGTASPKFFYLPAEPKYSVEHRSEVQFSRIFSLSHDYIQRCVSLAGTQRLCGLTPEATRHLQWTLSVFLSRNAREDFDWPSNADLLLKREHLLALGGRGKRDLQALEIELKRRGVDLPENKA